MLPGDANGQAWRNRIVGYGEEAPDNLLANPRNWRIHSKLQQEALAGVLNEVGWIQNVIVNRTTQHVLDGHLRITLAMRHGEPTVPITYVELSEEEEALALATFDPIGALASAEKETLDALLRDVQTGSQAVQEMLAGLAETSVMPYGDISTDRHGQGVSSTWDQVKSVDREQLILGDLEFSIEADVVRQVRERLEAEFRQKRQPYGVTMAMLLAAGLASCA